MTQIKKKSDGVIGFHNFVWYVCGYLEKNQGSYCYANIQKCIWSEHIIFQILSE